jgi:hypothetical protein
MAFAVLQDYPKEGPEMPEREKLKRAKDRHESGTGRRDREKRQGRGQSNWGNPIDDGLAVAQEEERDYEEDLPEPEPGITDFVPAEGLLDSDDDEEPKKAKSVVKVPPQYAGLVHTGDDVEVIAVDEPLRPLKPTHEPTKKRQAKREVDTAEKGVVPQEDEEEDENEAGHFGKKKLRDQKFHGVQHNRNRGDQKGGQQVSYTGQGPH